MRIGITSPKIEKLNSNGARFNAVLWYDFIQRCGHDAYFVTDEATSNPNYRFIHFTDDDALTLDVVLHVKLFDLRYFELLPQHGIRLIFVLLGSIYHNDVHSLTDKSFADTLYGENMYRHFDEVWISPHFQYCLDYYRIRYDTQVFIGPYFWRNDLVKDTAVLGVHDGLKVAIFEPNIEQAKNCVIPIAICERAHAHIQEVKVFNTHHIKDRTFLKTFVLNSQLQRERKITVESRHPFPEIMSKYCNCVVSCVEDCDLNYLFLECFYLGIPLVHNSEMLKDYGYYYPKFNIERGAEQIVRVITSHNKQQYISRHKPLLQKYSIDNPMYIEWTNARLEDPDSLL